MREGTDVVSFQTLRWDITTKNSKQFDPGQYIYPNADVEANIFMAAWSRHFTWLDRPSSFSLLAAGGNVQADVSTTGLPPQYLPPGVAGGTFSQSASGFADPAAQFVVNLIGTPPLRSNVDLLNYEPTWTLDFLATLAFPVGDYDNKQLVNLGQNRWFGRIGFPFKYHFGAFTPGYMNTLEITPSVWLFAENDEFVGQSLDNEPMWQVEAHLTHDFTATLSGSVDLLYRQGFQSEIDGVDVGDELDIGNVGFSLNYVVNDNIMIRTSFGSNVFGDSDVDNSVLRLQFVYGWNQSSENAKKLLSH